MPKNYTSLTVRWDKRGRDFVYYAPCNADAHMIHNKFFCHSYGPHIRADHKDSPFGERLDSLLEELEKRGYDTSTLVFKCKLKKGTI
jgi:hypothetical protein